MEQLLRIKYALLRLGNLPVHCSISVIMILSLHRRCIMIEASHFKFSVRDVNSGSTLPPSLKATPRLPFISIPVLPADWTSTWTELDKLGDLIWSRI